MSIVVVDSDGELVAYISDTVNIVNNGYEVIDYGDNEPVFEDINGRVYLKENSFILNP